MTDAALYVCALVLASAIMYVLAPLLDPPRAVEDAASSDAARAERLVAQKAAIYQAIRDAELDRQTGKLSEEDAAALVSELKGRAMAVLRELDGLRIPDGTAQKPPAQARSRR